MDAMNLLELTCAVVAALALGVLLAHSCCQLFFTLLRMHARSLQPRSATLPVQPVEPQVVQVS